MISKEVISIVESLIKYRLKKGNQGKCRFCGTVSTVRIPDDMFFHQETEETTYMGIYYANCNHVVPIGQIKFFEGSIVTFGKLHDIYMKEYYEKNNLESYRKALRMLGIESGKIELQF